MYNRFPNYALTWRWYWCWDGYPPYVKNLGRPRGMITMVSHNNNIDDDDAQTHSNQSITVVHYIEM